MKMMLTWASQKVSVSAVFFLAAIFLSFILFVFALLTSPMINAGNNDLSSHEHHCVEWSVVDLTGNAFGRSKKNWLNSPETPSYAITLKAFEFLFLHSINEHLELHNLNFRHSQQIEIISQTNQIINVLPALLKPKSLLKTVIFNQRIII